MSAKQQSEYQYLSQLLDAALATGDAAPLEAYLREHSGLPGPRLNLALAAAFAETVGAVVSEPHPPVEQLEKLLDGWAALSLADAPVNNPREMLPATALLTYGQVAVARPDWWSDEIGKLRRGASDGRWRARELVATALQRMLAADWPRTLDALAGWARANDPLVVRAAVAASAEPPLLTSPERGREALAILALALDTLAALPAEQRRAEPARVLRQALGYAVSVATVAAPDEGFALLARLAQSGDADLHWIARENLKKRRLARWPEQIAAVRLA
ncbi:MAG TPA: hypothetical protein VFU78_14005 [Thermomicrobiales bacterium]|nr:hypothetical protein [Thermomicrobiales bacterium]